MGQTYQDNRQESQTTATANHTGRPIDLARYRRRRQRRLVWQRVVHHLTGLVVSHGPRSAAPLVSLAVAEGRRPQGTQRPE
jgi:hypothetical protein